MLTLIRAIATPGLQGGIAIAGRTGTSLSAVRSSLMTTAVVVTALAPTVLREVFPAGTGRHRR